MTLTWLTDGFNCYVVVQEEGAKLAAEVEHKENLEAQIMELRQVSKQWIEGGERRHFIYAAT